MIKQLPFFSLYLKVKCIAAAFVLQKYFINTGGQFDAPLSGMPSLLFCY